MCILWVFYGCRQQGRRERDNNAAVVPTFAEAREALPPQSRGKEKNLLSNRICPNSDDSGEEFWKSD